MNVTCPECGLKYDDLYRLTYCPHEDFQMRTRAMAHGEEKLCTSVEELDAFIAGAEGDRKI